MEGAVSVIRSSVFIAAHHVTRARSLRVVHSALPRADRSLNAGGARLNALAIGGITWRSVGKRDGWTCHLCGDPVIDSAGTAHNPEGATVDHLTPIALGGSHTWSNVALAHRSCNVLRGARPLAA